MSTSPSPVPSAITSRHGESPYAVGDDGQHLEDDPFAGSVSVETLVEHLLAAKRSLSSMTLVLRANDLSTHARQLHEESVILGAQAAFLKKGIDDQTKLLIRVRRNMIWTYDAAKREFKKLLRTLDDANGKLETTMGMLKDTVVDPLFRPEGEEPKNLLDFVDENQVHDMREALKANIGELQATLTSFDSDLFRFDSDIRVLDKKLREVSTSPSPSKSPDDSAGPRPELTPVPDLLELLIEKSHSMAGHLTSLTRHFDLCVTAIRITEGGAALARRKAAEDSAEADPVSISGVIAEQDTNIDDLDPAAKSEIVHMVVQDAAEVDDVVADMAAEMQQAEVDFNFLKDQTDQVNARYAAVTQAFHILEDIGSRLSGYIAGETEFIDRWEAEKQSIFARLGEMENLRDFYEGYASAYDSLILEVERRKAVEEKIHNIWRKAKEQVDKLVEADWNDRETFRAEVGDYIPTDLWVGMSGPLRKWEVIRAQAGTSPTSPGGKAVAEEMPKQEEGSAATLGRNVVDAARDRIHEGAR